MRQRSHRLADKTRVFYTLNAGSTPAGIATSGGAVLTEEQKKKFCKSMGMTYTPPPPPAVVPKDPIKCLRASCNNTIMGVGYRDFCSPACYHRCDIPKARDRDREGS